MFICHSFCDVLDSIAAIYKTWFKGDWHCSNFFELFIPSLKLIFMKKNMLNYSKFIRKMDGQHFTHQIWLKILNMIFLTVNFLFVKKKSLNFLFKMWIGFLHLYAELCKPTFFHVFATTLFFNCSVPEKLFHYN